ncbi:MAG: helix-turn-helix domain-containing protein [Deltaproteobacteria bacterium]|jgi:DNA-binding XRE family transcriptional regulator|nr:helix-turn-helix domain-containing protein [Deltaproteobacteria bacterium]
MSLRTAISYPVLSTNGQPSHVLVPIEDFDALLKKSVANGHVFVPLDVGEAVLEGDTPLKAWRNHKRLTQKKLAECMGVTRSSYSQMEKSLCPQKATLEKAASALGIELAQLVELYGD